MKYLKEKSLELLPIVGPNAAGKGTLIGNLMNNQYGSSNNPINLYHMSMSTELIKSYGKEIVTSNLAGDTEVFRSFENYLKKLETSSSPGIVFLDGLPRKESQVDYLFENFGHYINRGLQFDISENIIRERSENRRLEALSRHEEPRAMDDPAQVEKRISEFYTTVLPGINHLRENYLQGNLFLIDGNKKPEEILSQVENHLKLEDLVFN